MGMRGNARSVQSRAGTPLVLAGLLVVPVYTGGAFAQGDGEDSAFQYEERSTIDTIPLSSMEEETPVSYTHLTLPTTPYV